MTRPIALALQLVALVTAAHPSGAGAQVSGTIVGDQGEPIHGALVELWSPTERLGGQRTDVDGGFFFRSELTGRATVLLARLVGYAPLRVGLNPTASALRLELQRLPQRLPAVVIDGRSGSCPVPDSPAARHLWSVVAERYDASTSDAWWADFLIDSRRVPAESFGMIDTARLGTGQVGAARTYLDAWSLYIGDHGYGRPYNGMVGRFDHWEYPPLQSLMAPHFVEALFGRLHTFATDSTPLGDLVLRFCSRRGNGPLITGSLVLGRDTSLIRATWTYSTPEPSEVAGGEVIFAPPDVTGPRSPVLPISGFYWRKLVFDYYQEWTEYRRWHNCDDEPQSRFCRSR